MTCQIVPLLILSKLRLPSTYCPRSRAHQLQQVHPRRALVDMLNDYPRVCVNTDPFAVTAVLSRQLSVTREQWLKYTRNTSDPDSSLYTQDQLANALQTPGNEHLVKSASFAASVETAFPGLHHLTSRYRQRYASFIASEHLQASMATC